jgi:ribonuclease/clavin/mitogillin
MAPVTIVNVGYRSTNFWVVSAGRSRLLVFDVQVPFVEPMARWAKTDDHYTPITLNDNTVVAVSAGRGHLARLGIEGGFVHTPGHSDDSVSLVFDDGSAFTGDLTWPALVGPENADTVAASWDVLRSAGAKRVYAGHGPVRGMP